MLAYGRLLTDIRLQGGKSNDGQPQPYSSVNAQAVNCFRGLDFETGPDKDRE